MTELNQYRLQSDELHLDERARLVTLNDKKIELRPTSYVILAKLLRQPKTVLPYSALVPNKDGEDLNQNSVANAIKRLRDALGEPYSSRIETHRGVGLSYESSVRRVLITSAASAASLFNTGDSVPGITYFVFDRLASKTGDIEAWHITEEFGERTGYAKIARSDEGLSQIRRSLMLSDYLRGGVADSYVLQPLGVRLDEEPAIIAWENHGHDLAFWGVKGALTSIGQNGRLRLYQQICEAVAALHAEGVVHGDIKPGNILALDPAKPDAGVRIIDFTHSLVGLDGADSETLKRRALDVTLQSSGDQQALIGSIDYIAPEIYNHAVPTRAADVYALGKLLIKMAIGHVNDLMPSDWVATLNDPILSADITDFTRSNADLRPATAATIVERMASLEDRKSAWATDQAERARLKEEAERLKRMRARRPWLVLSTAALAIAAVTGFWAAAKTDTARRIAIAERDSAKESRDFLQDILATGDPQNPGAARDATVMEAMQEARKKLADGEISDPLTRVAIYDVISNILVNHGDKDAAIEVMQEAITYLESISPQYADDKIKYKLALADQFILLGRNEEASLISEQAGDDLAKLHQPSVELLETSARMRARALYHSGAFAEAIPYFEEALTYNDQFENDPRNIGNAIIGLSDAYLQTGDVKAGVDIISDFAATNYVTSGAMPPRDRLTLSTMRARLLAADGLPGEALAVLEASLVDARSIGAGTWTEGAIKAEIGDTANRLGEFELSQSAYKDAEEIACRVFGSQSWFCPYLEGMAGAQALRLGETRTAVTQLTDASIRLVDLNPDARHFVDTYLLQAHIADGDQAQALIVFKRIDFDTAKSLGDDGLWAERKRLLGEIVNEGQVTSDVSAEFRAGEKAFFESQR